MLFRLRREVYLDNNATTRVSKPVRQKINQVLKTCHGNPSSLYQVARNSAEILAEARRQVAQTINAQDHEIFFTGSATEANNAVLKAIAQLNYPHQTKIVATPIEHSSVISTLDFLATQGVQVDYCPVDAHGRVQLASLETCLDEHTSLLCCMLANNEVGTIQDIPALARLARRHQILFMADCVQALGKMPIDVKALGVDYASFSAHKIHGPKGVGALYIKSGSPFLPLIHGGHQEFGQRAGTEGLHNIAGFATACSQVPNLLQQAHRVRELKHYLIQAFQRLKPDCLIHSPTDDYCLPNTVSVTFPNINNAMLMAMLDYHGIAVSAGSACNTQDDTPSHVLKALGLSEQQARETLRFSCSGDTSITDIKYVIKTLADYFSGAEKIPIHLVTPAQLNENLLFAENIYILDVRFPHERKLAKGLPRSHEASFVAIRKYVKQIPPNKNILVVCEMGYNSSVVAYYLKSKRFKNVSFLLTGLMGWRWYYPELYRRYGGQNVTVLTP